MEKNQFKLNKIKLGIDSNENDYWINMQIMLSTQLCIQD